MKVAQTALRALVNKRVPGAAALALGGVLLAGVSFTGVSHAGEEAIRKALAERMPAGMPGPSSSTVTVR